MADDEHDNRKTSEGAAHRTGVAPLLVEEHAALLGRVAMALLGDALQVELVLERVAHEAGTKPVPEDIRPVAWLLGLVRTASAVQLSKLPKRSRHGEADAPVTERMGAALEAAPARAALTSLKPTEREAVVLALVGGLEVRDLAAACNVDLGTAKTRLARGLEQLLLGVAPTTLGKGEA